MNRGAADSILEAFTRLRRVVYALLLRDMRDRYGKYALGYLWAFIDPVLRVLVLSILHAVFLGGKLIYGASPIYFFFLGVWAFLLFINSSMSAIGVFGSARALFSYRNVRPIDTWLSKVVSELLLYILIFLLLVLVAWWFGLDLEFEQPLQMMAVVFLLYLLGASLGLLIETAGAQFEDVRKAGRLINRPLFWASGMFFTIDMVPNAIRPILIWNPVLHATDLIRGYAIAGYEPQGSILYLGLWVVGLMGLSLMYYRRHRFDVVRQ